MKSRILITGVTGLIGKAVLAKLLSDDQLELTALVRPHTNPERYAGLPSRIDLVQIDLGDIPALTDFLANQRFDVILHIGALRGGRNATKKEFYRTNVESTEQLIEHALNTKCRLVFCSSVGVFGAIPDEMPANNETTRKDDNYYHYTKIMAEKAINQAILRGLNAVIVRPAITYGIGDNGFPYGLVKLIAHRLFMVSNKNIWMHLCHIDTITTALVNLAVSKTDIIGKSYNVADFEPVQLRDLVNFISRQLVNTNYPKYLSIDNGLLHLGEKISRMLKNELWVSRFELISHSWFYHVSEAYQDLELPFHYTIPDFRLVVADYKNTKR
jgi:dihydroflavonol-4-reductase